MITATLEFYDKHGLALHSGIYGKIPEFSCPDVATAYETLIQASKVFGACFPRAKTITVRCFPLDKLFPVTRDIENLGFDPSAKPDDVKHEGAELVHRLLDVSTAHIPRETAEMIESGKFPHTPAMEREEGWLFCTINAGASHDSDDESPCAAFRSVMQRAIDLGCDWVLFDRDGDCIEDLPTYEW